MKGTFQLKPHPMYPEYILFGNLGSKTFDPNLYTVFSENANQNISARVIAHDVIEHSKAHRKNDWVTVREELNALGAALFVRPEIDISYDLDFLRKYPTDLKPITHIKLPTFVCSEMFSDEIDPIFIDHLNYGYWIKHTQFKGDSYKANRAFRFIEENVAKALRYYPFWEPCYLSINFDTDQEKFTSRVRNLYGKSYV